MAFQMLGLWFPMLPSSNLWLCQPQLTEQDPQQYLEGHMFSIPSLQNQLQENLNFFPDSLGGQQVKVGETGMDKYTRILKHFPVISYQKAGFF